jgi:DNA-binding response OmpR family regulator
VRVLVAEDDDTLGAVLAQGLRSRGYVVDLVADGESALSYARCYEYAVAVLDWLMPRVSGIDVVRQLRRTGARTPVLMISGKGAPEDRVAGLDAGADDYLVKPFVFDELLARLRALQRRPPDVLPPRLVVGDLECDPASREVTFGGRRPALTSTELSILETLMRFSPAVAERRQIAQHVWTDEVDTFSSNTIDVHLARLRAKLSGSRVRIQTVRGVGYRIVADNGQRLAGQRAEDAAGGRHDRTSTSIGRPPAGRWPDEAGPAVSARPACRSFSRSRLNSAMPMPASPGAACRRARRLARRGPRPAPSRPGVEVENHRQQRPTLLSRSGLAGIN